MCSSSNTSSHCQKYLRSHQISTIPFRYRGHASGTEEAVHVISPCKIVLNLTSDFPETRNYQPRYSLLDVCLEKSARKNFRDPSSIFPTGYRFLHTKNSDAVFQRN